MTASVARDWLDPHLGDRAVSAAHAAASGLGAPVLLQLMAAGDRLALHSPAVALAYYRRAAAAWLHFGALDFERWFELGASLLTAAPSSPAGATRFFELAPHTLDLARAAQWCELGRALTQRARHLGRSYFERSASELAADGGGERLPVWVAAGLALAHSGAARAAVLSEAYFEHAPLTAAEPTRWVRVALALGDAIDPGRFFAAPPSGLLDAEQALFFEAIARFAAHAPDAAARVYRELPALLAELAPGARAGLLAVLAHLDATAGSALAELVPALATTFAQVPSAQLDAALRHVAGVADQHTEAALAALRLLPALYQNAEAADVARWFAAGLRVGADNAAAARAFFALESRAGVSWLRAASSAVELDDDLGVWRKLIQMLSDEVAIVRRSDVATLRPPLEPDPDACGVALPLRIAWLPAREQNRGLYRWLSLQLAGRREFGTYARPGLYARLRHGRAADAPPSALEALFLVAEGVRVQQHLARAYPGSVRETQQLASALLAAWQAEPKPTFAEACDALLALALSASPRSQLPRWLPLLAAEEFLHLLAPLAHRAASVERSLAVARRLLAWCAGSAFRSPGADPAALEADGFERANLYQLAGADASLQTDADSATAAARFAGESPLDPDAQPEPGASDGEAGASPAGSMLDADDDDDVTAEAASRAPRRSPPGAQSFVYDEWDHSIGDYRSRHCRVHEIAAASDSGAFFERTRIEYASMLYDVRRQFERMRPERYRPLRGLEDGEDFDLNALTEARIEARAGRTPQARVYTARTRQTRDVATLFLLDMSASTEQPFAEPGEPPTRRIIDTLKEALVVMSSALDELGDSYAIYGFSSRGRQQVEVYPVKAFGEPLSATVKARIGGIEPKSGTRMGAALRHVIGKFAAVHARSKHLILLSDGFPQDQEYGTDRRSHSYGIEDTAVALREVNTSGATPFCITVDRAGNDYLRYMCAEAQYLVIDELDALPRELPKIYRRVVQS